MTPRILFLTCLALLPFLGGSLEAHSSTPLFAPRQTVHIDGPAVCNCSTSTAERPLCHAASLVVGIGGERVWVDTGFGGACVNTAVPPGRCVFYRYELTCFDRGVAGWDCYLNSAGIACDDVSPTSDC